MTPSISLAGRNILVRVSTRSSPQSPARLVVAVAMIVFPWAVPAVAWGAAMPTFDPAGLPDEVKMLIERTLSPDAADRADAAQRLGEMGERAAPAIPFLLQAVEDDRIVEYGKQHTVSSIACRAIGKIGEAAVQPCVAAVMASPSTEHREKLQLAVAQFRDQRAIEVLTSLLQSTDSELRRAVAVSLEHSSDPRVVMPLLDAFGDTNEQVRRVAVTHFERHADARAVDRLIEVLRTRDPSVRVQAIRSLGTQRDWRATAVLSGILRDLRETDDARTQAAEALGEIDDASVLPILLRALEDAGQPWCVRCAVARGLGCLSDHRAVERLSSALMNAGEPYQVRVAAARAMAQVGGDEAVATLTAVATAPSEDDRVRFWASICAVDLADGAIDDAAVVAGIRRGYDWRIGLERQEAHDARIRALQAMLENGTTRSVRSSAKRALFEIRGVGRHNTVLAVLCALYYLCGMSTWAFCSRASLKRRQLTLRSVFGLVALIAIGLPLLAGALDVWR